MTEKTLYLMTGPYWDKDNPLMELIDYFRDESMFRVNSGNFDWDEEEWLDYVDTWLKETECGYFVVEAPEKHRVDIITEAILNDWKVVEFEIVLRKSKDEGMKV